MGQLFVCVGGARSNHSQPSLALSGPAVAQALSRKTIHAITQLHKIKAVFGNSVLRSVLRFDQSQYIS